MTQPGGATARARERASRRAVMLGPVKLVEPARRGPDGAPWPGPGQVYVTRTGLAFHRTWCAAIARRWAALPSSLLVTTEDAVGLRHPCPDCATP